MDGPFIIDAAIQAHREATIEGMWTELKKSVNPPPGELSPTELSSILRGERKILDKMFDTSIVDAILLEYEDNIDKLVPHTLEEIFKPLCRYAYLKTAHEVTRGEQSQQRYAERVSADAGVTSGSDLSLDRQGIERMITSDWPEPVSEPVSKPITLFEFLGIVPEELARPTRGGSSNKKRRTKKRRTKKRRTKKRRTKKRRTKKRRTKKRRTKKRYTKKKKRRTTKKEVGMVGK
jgi:hypothetical protein